MVINLLFAILIAVVPGPMERKVTFYWPGEDLWGNAVADQNIMRGGDPGIESWDYNWCAVSRDLLSEYPYGTILMVSGLGFYAVHDTTASWVKNTVDIRVPEPFMQCYTRKVWVILKP